MLAGALVTPLKPIRVGVGFIKKTNAKLSFLFRLLQPVGVVFRMFINNYLLLIVVYKTILIVS